MEMADPSDPVLTREIVDAIRDGDRAAFDALFNRVGARVYVYILGRMGTRLRKVVDPEDVLQEVYTEAYQSFDRFVDRGPGSMGRWLVGLARNQIRRLYKRHFAYEKRCALREVPYQATPSHPGVLAEAESGDPTPSRIIARDERNRKIARALESLAAGDRQLILLYVYEGLPLSRIAERLDTPRSTLAYRLAAALGQIGGQLA